MNWLFKWHFIVRLWIRKLGHIKQGVLDSSLVIVWILGFWGGIASLILYLLGLKLSIFNINVPKYFVLFTLFALTLLLDFFVILKKERYLRVAKNYRKESIQQRKRDLIITTVLVSSGPVLALSLLLYMFVNVSSLP